MVKKQPEYGRPATKDSELNMPFGRHLGARDGPLKTSQPGSRTPRVGTSWCAG